MDLEEVASFMEEEMAGCGRLQGCWFHLRAIQRGFIVSQETMKLVIMILDPEGVELQYSCRGPGHLTAAGFI